MSRSTTNDPTRRGSKDQTRYLAQLLKLGAGIAARLEEIMSNKEVTLEDLAFPEDIKAIRKEDRLRQYLEKVDTAIKRIDEGMFGRCLGCGATMSASVLEATPWAERCADCEDS